MTDKPGTSELRLRSTGPTVLVCVRAQRKDRRGERLSALLAPRVGEIQLSSTPEEIRAPELTLVVEGWGELDSFLALRECQLRFATPVVVFVGPRLRALIPDLLRAGASDCLRWPLPDAELLARVEMRLKREPEEITLDSGALTLRCGAVHARLTRTEYHIMRSLLNEPSRWSTHEQIAKASLGRARSQNLLRVHIHSIRRKLKSEAWRLLSDRNLGYRFVTSSQPGVETADSILSRDGRASKD